jgi:rSAM/selenodomain-associated transferase 2
LAAHVPPPPNTQNGVESVSIIIPVLNEAARVAQAIGRAWAAGPLEVIVVDGGSRDATCEIAAQCRCQLLESTRGRGLQQNVGARRAAGAVLLFLHADTWLDPQAISQIHAALRDPRVLVGCFRQRIEADGMLYRLLEHGNAWRVRRRGMVYGDQGIFFRRSWFEEMDGFPEVPLMEDWLLMRRLRRLSWPILLPGPVHVSPRRWQRNGIIRQTLRNWALVSAARLGVSTERLARFYRHER